MKDWAIIRLSVICKSDLRQCQEGANRDKLEFRVWAKRSVHNPLSQARFEFGSSSDFFYHNFLNSEHLCFCLNLCIMFLS